MKKEIKILHVIENPKFLTYCKGTFDLSHLKNTFITPNELKNNPYALESVDILIIHFLEYTMTEFLNKSRISIPVLWFLWGGDAFMLGEFHNKFLLKKTAALKIKLAFENDYRSGIRKIAQTIFPRFFDRQKLHQSMIKSFDKIDIIIPVVPGDYDLLQKAYQLKATMFHLNYVNPIFQEGDIHNVTARNILLGNSSTITCNHIEAIDELAKLDLRNRKVIIPLNYGDENYRDYIHSYARKKLKNTQKCLIEFLPYNEYQKILSTCSILVMNHLRQQAVGNIVQALLNGANIYLNKSSTVYDYLIEKEFIISSMDDLHNLKELTIEEKEFNRLKCSKVFGAKQQHKKVEDLINLSLGLNEEEIQDRHLEIK